MVKYKYNHFSPHFISSLLIPLHSAEGYKDKCDIPQQKGEGYEGKLDIPQKSAEG